MRVVLPHSDAPSAPGAANAPPLAGFLLPAPRRHRPGVRFSQTLPSALESIWANKGRSVLTTLGIIIGVAAVIAIVALAQGARLEVNQRLAGLGTNLLTVFPGSTASGGVRGGAGSVTTLTVPDAIAIRREVAGIAHLSPVVSGGAQLIASEQNWQTRVQAVQPEYQQIQNWSVAEGGFFTDEDDLAARNVALLGQTVAHNLFPDGASPLGREVRIRNVPFVVVGVLAGKGAASGFDQDDVVLIPFRTGQIRLFGLSALSFISLQVESTDQLDGVMTEVRRVLVTRHRLRAGQADDFFIRNNNDIIQTVQSISQTLTLLLAGVAAVSLIVGGIGIMNIMLVSVTERTREIGIRMAIGARPGDVLAQFLVEAVALALLGGLIGVALGIVVALEVPPLAGWPTQLSEQSIALAFGFAGLVGVFFGFYPARCASQLDPIEALRHE